MTCPSQPTYVDNPPRGAEPRTKSAPRSRRVRIASAAPTIARVYGRLEPSPPPKRPAGPIRRTARARDLRWRDDAAESVAEKKRADDLGEEHVSDPQRHPGVPLGAASPRGPSREHDERKSNGHGVRELRVACEGKRRHRAHGLSNLVHEALPWPATRFTAE